MTSPLDSLVTITFVADANTPPEFVPSAGRVMDPSEDLLKLNGWRLEHGVWVCGRTHPKGVR